MIENSQSNRATNAWVPITWEPVVGSGERLTVGAIVRIDGMVTAHQVIRNEVLDCLYGKQAPNVRAMIGNALELFRLVREHEFDLDAEPIEGFFAGATR